MIRLLLPTVEGHLLLHEVREEHTKCLGPQPCCLGSLPLGPAPETPERNTAFLVAALRAAQWSRICQFLGLWGRRWLRIPVELLGTGEGKAGLPPVLCPAWCRTPETLTPRPTPLPESDAPSLFHAWNPLGPVPGDRLTGASATEWGGGGGLTIVSNLVSREAVLGGVLFLESFRVPAAGISGCGPAVVTTLHVGRLPCRCTSSWAPVTRPKNSCSPWRKTSWGPACSWH